MFLVRTDLLYANPDRLCYGVAVTDIDGDGLFEFVVAGFGCANIALKWTGRGYLDCADAVFADPHGQAIGLAAGDLDADGVEELYILNSDTFAGSKHQNDRLFALHGGTRVDLFAQPEAAAITNPSAGRSVAVIDRTGAGRYAFVVANYGARMRLYELDNQWRLGEHSRAAGLTYASGGRGLAVGQLFGSDVDIVCINERGPNLVLANAGDGTFSDVAAACGLQDRLLHGRGISLFDANDDGRLDIAYGNWEGEQRLWIRDDGPYAFVDCSPASFAQPGRVRTVIAADFDNDGNPEVFFNCMGEPNRLFGRRDGAWVALDIGDARESDGLGTGAAIADLDGDGRLELLIAHGESAPQPLSLYHVAPNTNHWLRVRPLTRAGAPARGALVVVQMGHRRVAQSIDGGSGYLCQMEPIAHFGLGTVRDIDQVSIQWPSGATIIITRPHVDQVLIVPHPAVDDDQIL
jgi:hypothetical protein